MIVPANWEAVVYVSTHMREDDFNEVMALRWDDSPYSFAAEHMRLPGPKYAALADDGTPVAIGGIASHQPGIGQAWLVCTDRVDECSVEIALADKEGIELFMATPGCHRIHAYSLATHTRAHRWMEMLGMHEEARLAKYGKRGEDFILFSILRED